MNIFLIPYTWSRHLSIAFWCGMFGLSSWLLVLSWFLFVGPFWRASWDGAIFLICLSGFVAFASLLGEGNLFRWTMKMRVLKSLFAGVLAMLFSVLGYWFWEWFSSLIFSIKTDVDDPSLVSLKYQLGDFIAAGLATSSAVLIVRKFKDRYDVINHLLAGVISGLAGAGVWAFFHSTRGISQHLYYASAFGCLAFGFFFGLCAWGLPDKLYAGWLRVLSRSRFGHRVPIDANGEAKERFVGNYPNGLDLYLPGHDGVMELHISVFVDTEQRYTLRGLSQQQTQVRRFLEWVRLDYDRTRPAPFDTSLSSEDRIRIGHSAELEFIMLPREET